MLWCRPDRTWRTDASAGLSRIDRGHPWPAMSSSSDIGEVVGPATAAERCRVARWHRWEHPVVPLGVPGVPRGYFVVATKA
jgi:hypothetical protein